MIDLRQSIEISLTDLGKPYLKDAALAFWRNLGYEGKRSLDINSFTELQEFAQENYPERLDLLKLLEPVVKKFHLLFQLTVEDLRLAGQGTLFSGGKFDNAIVDSYVFVVLELTSKTYSRKELADFTRTLNKLFNLPVFVLFKIGEHVTLSVIQRRVNLRNETRDVLERVSLIKDISTKKETLHRAHLDILEDLSRTELFSTKLPGTFVELERAWRGILDSSELNKKFFKELANWFYWASSHPHLKFPKDAKDNQANLIRLITRLIFVWFLKEKNLVPDDLFEPAKLKTILKTFNATDKQDSTYYQAVLQNLFFATLNTEMNRDQAKSRRFISKKSYQGSNPGYTVHGLYRYEDMFTDAAKALELFADVPFLNGGLFECLDERDEGKPEVRIDGFSTTVSKRANVPNELFFAQEQSVDLNSFYSTKGKRYKASGLLEILKRYKFTITENTPIEEEVALDPELLGRVFENLLAAYNPETESTARKETGSFYTPREIVDYMVDEALIAYFHTKLSDGHANYVPGSGKQAPLLAAKDEGAMLAPTHAPNEPDALERRIRQLLSYTNETHQFKGDEITRLIAAIDKVDILDPACGSGAFPMGVLQKLVYVLGKLDKNNERWKAQQNERIKKEIDDKVKTIKADLETARKISDKEVRQQAEVTLQERLTQLEQAFDQDRTDLDYARKLYLIENCIYGVDIQPIAVQIAKLRCFISLVIDQKTDDSKENRGILPLPNLETRFVAANSLEIYSLDQGIKPPEVAKLEQDLKDIHDKHFYERNYTKKKALRNRDREIRQEIADKITASGFASNPAEAKELAHWSPYNPNQSAKFFDTHWMFDLDGFDIVLGNPPYVRQEKIKDLKPMLKKNYDDDSFYVGTADLYVYFFARALKLLRPSGVLTYICSNKYFRSGYGKQLRFLLSQQSRIRLLIDFGDAPVFTAIAYPSILLTQKARPNGNEMRLLSWKQEDDIATQRDKITRFRSIMETDSFMMPQSSLGNDGWRIENSTVLDLLDKLRKAGKPLGEYVNGRFYYGIKTGLNEAFVVDRATRDCLIKEDPKSAEVLKPFLRGRDVKRWKTEFAEQYLVKIESSENKKHLWSGEADDKAEKIFAKTYPAIHKHFQQFRDGLINRYDQGHYFWELRACVYWDAFNESKIIYPDIYSEQSFMVDRENFYCGNTCYFIPTTEVWLSGLFNSKLIEWFYSLISNSVRGGYLRAFTDYMQQIPIAKPSDDVKQLITKLVEYLLYLSNQTLTNPKDKLMIRFFEQVIDALVYELYLPDELHAADRHPFAVVSAETFPALTGKNDLEMLRTLFDKLHDPNHPVRKLVYFLDSVEVVRLIQGKNTHPSPT